MNLVNESDMIQILGCTKQSFDGYLEANVFAPVVCAKKGRRTKGAVYDADTVQKEVDAFQAGKFSPVAIIQPQVSESNGDISNGPKEGKVIRLSGLPPDPDDSFDFAKEIGDISTFKLLKAAVVKCTGRLDVPLKVKKDLHKTYELLCKERERKEARKRKVPVEKHEADCQKIFDASMSAWSGEAGIEAASKIVDQIEQSTGKPLRREISNIVSVVHRAIVETSNRVIQPHVLKILEKV